ncbi:MAG: 2-phospho-L-lactate guanylyltransferase [Candidatus Nitrosopelagicus sp.]|nr:2-phospho-L-lactate guanylyltransferase [Candidatus Nitrosopelagicus sp.]
MKTSVIIPVKSFQKSKTRLLLSKEKTKELCRLLLEEVIKTVSESGLIDKIIVVTDEDEVSDIIKKYDCKKIQDEDEISVNNAVKLAENYLIENEFTHSIVLPLDVPFFYSEDIEKLLNFTSERSVLIVPSRHFDGTNALVRSPINSMTPRYDEGSYSFQIESAKNNDIKITVGLIYRLMLDIDSKDDLEFVLKHNIKPEFCQKIKKIIEK